MLRVFDTIRDIVLGHIVAYVSVAGLVGVDTVLFHRSKALIVDHAGIDHVAVIVSHIIASDGLTDNHTALQVGVTYVQVLEQAGFVLSHCSDQLVIPSPQYSLGAVHDAVLSRHTHCRDRVADTPARF